jgi:hypothetical protein
MRLDKLKQYVSLRQDLTAEKHQIEARLNVINQALATAGSAAPAPRRGPGRPPKAVAVAAAPVAAAPKRRGRRKFKRAKNTMSLKEAVSQATKSRPLAKKDILTAVKKAGYIFTATDPMNSLNTLLYGDKGFKNHGAGKFGPA